MSGPESEHKVIAMEAMYNYYGPLTNRHLTHNLMGDLLGLGESDCYQTPVRNIVTIRKSRATRWHQSRSPHRLP
jgi:hypothetical protein